MTTLYHRPQPALSRIFLTFASIGIQSFGGGSATLFLIHQACIQNGWTDEPEFARAWALVQVSPGINLAKLTLLVGFQLRGWPGLIAALAGMLLPSAIITVLMTAGYASLRDQPAIRAIMRGIAPATIGLSLAMAVQLAAPLLTRARHEGRRRLASHWLVLLGSALLLALAHVTPVLVLALAGALTALLMAVLPVRRPAPAPTPEGGQSPEGRS